MKVELTDRDKRTLTILGVFVIVVCIGYWGVFGQIKKANDYKDEIEEQENLQKVYETKVMQLDLVEMNNQNLEALIEGAKDNYYPMMDSEEVDKLVTNTIIEKYGLFAYDLTISECQLASLTPYQYSDKALTGYSEAKINAMQAAAPIVNEDGMVLFGDEFSEDEETSYDSSDYSYDEFSDIDVPTTGIYVTTVQLRIGGDKEVFQTFLDDMATTSKKLRLVDYSLETVTETIEIIPEVTSKKTEKKSDDENEDNDDVNEVETFATETEKQTEEITSDYLDVTIELYMCQE